MIYMHVDITVIFKILEHGKYTLSSLLNAPPRLPPVCFPHTFSGTMRLESLGLLLYNYDTVLQ